MSKAPETEKNTKLACDLIKVNFNGKNLKSVITFFGKKCFCGISFYILSQLVVVDVVGVFLFCLTLIDWLI